MNKLMRFLATLVLFIVVFYGGAIIYNVHQLRYESFSYLMPFCFGYGYAVLEFLLNRYLARKLG